jgi:hypothetical protein
MPQNINLALNPFFVWRTCFWNEIKTSLKGNDKVNGKLLID